MSINTAIISGNLTRDCERKKVNDTSLVNFCVAVNESRKDREGNWTNYANYIDCTLFGKRAEKLADSLAKGVKVCVSGKLRYQSWEKDEQKHSKVSIIVDEIELPYMKPEKTSADYTQFELPF